MLIDWSAQFPGAPDFRQPEEGFLVYGPFARFEAAIAEVAGLLHPWCCLCCGAPGAAGLDLCSACGADLPWLERPCPRCALPLPAAGAGTCARCAHDPPAFDTAWIPFRYAFPIDRLVIGLKFAAQLERARLLGCLLGGWLAPRLTGTERPQLLIPTPLHAERARQRGFNQANEIARPVAAALGLPLGLDAVVRVRATAEQTLLNAAARRANLEAAFTVRAELPAHVAILDDVVTTGATASALALALRAAGVLRVTLVAAARAL